MHPTQKSHRTLMVAVELSYRQPVERLSVLLAAFLHLIDHLIDLSMNSIRALGLGLRFRLAECNGQAIADGDTAQDDKPEHESDVNRRAEQVHSGIIPPVHCGSGLGSR